MMRKKNILEMGYVCIPSNFSIHLKRQMVHSNNKSGMGVGVTVRDNDREIFSYEVMTVKALNSRFVYDEVLKETMETLFTYTREDFQRYILQGNMHGIKFYDRLKKVKSKLGTTLHTRS